MSELVCLLCRDWPKRITLSGCPMPPLPVPGGPPAGPLSPGASGSQIGVHRTETFFVGGSCFARIAAYHAVAHFERRLLSRLREELRYIPSITLQTSAPIRKPVSPIMGQVIVLHHAIMHPKHRPLDCLCKDLRHNPACPHTVVPS